MKIGYIGLGGFGSVVARRILLSHSLIIWDASPAAVATLQADSASVASSAIELAQQCDTILFNLPSSAALHDLLLGRDALADCLAGKLVIDQTNGVPSLTRDIAVALAQRGTQMIDAVVCGDPASVTAGRATIMASGPDAAYEKALPVLESITSTVYWCGNRVGDGQAMRTVDNAMNASCRLGTLEVVAMGRKVGLSLEVMVDVLNKGAGRNATTETMLPAIIRGTSSTSAPLELMLDDINKAVELGMECGVPMPISSAVRSLLQVGVNSQSMAAPASDAIGLVESMAGTRLVQPPEDASSVTYEVRSGRGDKDLTVGYVGLGAMGGALARRLMVSRTMNVFDTKADLMRQFESEGAVAAEDLPSLARACDVLMLCLPTSAIVREVLFRKGGLAEGLSSGKIVVDQTSGDPNETRSIAVDLQALGVQWVDAPVSGGPRGAVAGTIAIMCGGSAEAFGRVRPILESISPNIVYCGDTGNGHVAKLVNNATSSLCRLVTCECASVGVKYGLAISEMATVLNKSSGWSLASQRILPVLATGQQAANFQIQLMVKDLRLAAKLGISCGAPMMISNVVRGIFEMSANKFGGTANLDEISHLYEEIGGFTFTEGTPSTPTDPGRLASSSAT